MRWSLWFAVSVASLLLFGTGAPPAVAQQTIAEARSQGTGATVTVEGVVTRALGDFVRFQDESGATGASGLVVRQPSGPFFQDVQDGTIADGTRIRVEGTLSEFNGLLQINDEDLASYEILGETSIPAPQSVSLSTLNDAGEDYESELVTISDLQFTEEVSTFSADATYELTRPGSSSTFDFRVQGDDESEVGGTIAPPGTFTYTGVVGQFNQGGSATSGYQLIPVLRSDVEGGLFFAFTGAFNVSQEADGTVTAAVRAFNVPDGQSVTVSASASGDGTASVSRDLSGGISPSTLSFTGPNPAPQTVSLSLADDGETEGVEYLVLNLTSSDGAVKGTFTQWILDDATSQGPVAAGLEGSALRDALFATYGNPPTLGYGPARDTLYRRVFNENGTVEGFYSGYQVSVDPNGGDASGQALDGGVNTEHTYPQSLGAGDEPARSNMHILVPARDAVNSARSNYAYGEIPDAETDTWFFQSQSQSAPPSTNRDAWSELDDSPQDRDDRRFEPREAVKGDVARAVLYFATAYPNRTDLAFVNRQKATLLQWHQDDPVDAVEMRRNVLQAAYQGNRLNPFVVDPTLADRAFGTLEAPQGLTATADDTSIQLRWNEPLGGVVQGYNVYRATEAFTDPDGATKLNADPLVATTYTDADALLGQAYVYRIATVDDQGNESDLSASLETFIYPSTLTYQFSQSLSSPGSPTGYRLVALPGEGEAPVADVAGPSLGTANVEWTAYWDDGSDQNFLQQLDGSDTFTFRPGRGFWIAGAADLTVDRAVSNVSLSNAATTVPLHEGWNIISNPLPVDVDWTAVEGANGGSLQPIWAWDGAYAEAGVFATAASGQAYYFLNDSGLSELTIPLERSSGTAQPTQVDAQRVVALSVEEEGTSGATGRIVVGESSDASNGSDAHDLVAPPSPFGGAALHLVDEEASSERRARLLHERRAPATDGGHRYTVRLDATAGTAVTLRAETLPADATTSAVLVREDTGRRYDLRATPAVTINAGPDATPLTLLVGTKAFTEGTSDPVAKTMSLDAPAPNPFRDRTVFRYVLPEATHVQAVIYDLLGRRVRTLVDSRQPRGENQLTWDGTGASSQPLASGLYLVRWQIGDTQRVHKVMHVR